MIVIRSCIAFCLFIIMSILSLAAAAELDKIVGDDFSLWGLYNLGSGSGSGGFYAVDIDSDGINELVSTSTGYTSSNGGLVNVLKKVDGKYQISYRFVLPESRYALSGVLNSSPGDASENLLFISVLDKDIYVYDLFNRSRIAVINTPEVSKLLLQDIDSDGVNELVAISADQTLVFNIETYQIKYTYPFGARDAVFGHFTSADKVELALSSGKIYSINGANTQLVWSEVIDIFNLDVSDADKNNVDELIITTKSEIKTYNINEKKLVWSVASEVGASALRMFDLNNDGVKEVLYGDGQWGKIHALNPLTGTELWSVENPDWNVTDILVADIDEDAKLELIWGTWGSSSIYIYDIESLSEKHQVKDTIGPFHAYAVADVNNDGNNEIVAMSEKDKTLYVFDAENYSLQWSRTIEDFWNIRALTVADVYGDGDKEIVIGASNNSGGAVLVLNGSTGDIHYSKVLDVTSPIGTITIADLNNDNHNEIIVGNNKTDTGSVGHVFYVLDGSSGDVLRESSILSSSWGGIWNLNVLNIDNDPQSELIGTSNGSLFVYDLVTNVLSRPAINNISALTSGLVDGQIKIINGMADGSVNAMDNTFVPESLGQVCEKSVSNLAQYSPHQIIFVCGGVEFGLFNLTDRAVEWSYAAPINLGSVNGIQVKSLGNNRYLVGGDALVVFDIPAVHRADQTQAAHFKNVIMGNLISSNITEDIFIEITSFPMHGHIFVNPLSGDYTYTPAGNYVGSDEFSFAVTQKGLESNKSTVKITLENNFPLPVDQIYSMNMSEGELNRAVSATDADGDILTYQILQSTTKGYLTLDGKTGEFIYEASSGDETYEDSFTFQAYDGAYRPGMPEGTVKIKVIGKDVKGGSDSKSNSGGGAVSYAFILLLILFFIGEVVCGMVAKAVPKRV